MTDSANAAQAEFWTGEVGRRWAAHEAELEAMNRPIADTLLAGAALRPASRVLEVGCGTGGLSLDLARAVPEGEVLALDISPTLLARAEARRAAAGLANLAFREADAQTAPLPEGQFDRLVSLFGVMFFAGPVAAFANLRRALRPGARMVFACFAAPEANPWLHLPRAAAARRLGGPPEPPPGAPGPTAFADIGRVEAILAAAGFTAIAGEARGFHFAHPGGLDGAARLATILGPAAFILRQSGADEAGRQAVEDDIRAALRPFAGAGGLRIPVAANLFSARAP